MFRRIPLKSRYPTKDSLLSAEQEAEVRMVPRVCNEGDCHGRQRVLRVGRMANGRATLNCDRHGVVHWLDSEMME